MQLETVHEGKVGAEVTPQKYAVIRSAILAFLPRRRRPDLGRAVQLGLETRGFSSRGCLKPGRCACGAGGMRPPRSGQIS
jgi:hypothetical protein